MLCDNLEGWDGGGGWREVQEGGTYIYLWLNHDIWQKQTQYCKAILLQLKRNKLKKFYQTVHPIKTWADDQNIHFFQRGIQMTSGHMKRCST